MKVYVVQNYDDVVVDVYLDYDDAKEDYKGDEYTITEHWVEE